MIAVQAAEYQAIKKELKQSTPETIARVMQRSITTIRRVQSTKNYEQYKKMVRAEHIPKKPRRMKLKEHIREARIDELNRLLANGGFFTRGYAHGRIQELKRGIKK